MAGVNSAVYKAVCRKLLYLEVNAALEVCCLCLETVGKECYYGRDEVMLELGPNGPVFQTLADVVEILIGKNVSETLVTCQAVCKRCTLSAIASYKFIQHSMECLKTLQTAFKNFERCFDNCSENTYNCKSLYVAINSNNLDENMIIRCYDKRSTHTPETALNRFKVLEKQKKDVIFSHSCIDDSFDAGLDANLNIKRFRTRYSNIITDDLLHDKRNPKEYKCKLCLQVLATKKYLREHFIRIHFQRSEDLQQRLNNQDAKECDECGELVENKKDTIKEHELSHHGDYKCEICNRIFKQLWFYNKHRSQKSCDHSVKGLFVCDYCGHQFCHKYTLTRHIRYGHLGQKKDVCLWCGKNCLTPSGLKLHVLKHTKEKTAICSHCGQKFVNLHSLNNHMKRHTGEKNYKCEHCEQTFKNASLRKEHTRRKHLPPSEMCEICNKVFKTKGSLYKHKRRHTKGYKNRVKEV